MFVTDTLEYSCCWHYFPKAGYIDVGDKQTVDKFAVLGTINCCHQYQFATSTTLSPTGGTLEGVTDITVALKTFSDNAIIWSYDLFDIYLCKILRLLGYNHILSDYTLRNIARKHVQTKYFDKTFGRQI